MWRVVSQGLRIWLGVFGVLALLASGGQATPVVRNVGPFTVTFYNYGDSDGVETGQQDWTTEQMDDVASGIEVWDNGLANVPGRQINMHAFWINFPGSILGGSYSPSYGDTVNAWTYPERIWRDGINLVGQWTGFDTIIEYDTDAAGFAWNFGADAPAAGEIDFRSVIAHEIGHSIGFYDTYDDYDDTWGNNWGTAGNPYGFAGYRGLTQWDQHLRDDNNNRPANGSTGTPGNFNQLDNPVWWTGTIANALYGGPVPIYAPSTYQPGSSLSHLNGVDVPGALMKPSIGLGVMFRQPLPVEWAMMQDMGWTLQSDIAEPATLILAAWGLGGLAVAVRRRRKDA